MPSFSMLTSKTSPAFNRTGGVRKIPTPSGVPVAITSPSSSVRPCEIYLERYLSPADDTRAVGNIQQSVRRLTSGGSYGAHELSDVTQHVA